MIVDGVHYAGGCPTRAGAYPFCDNIDLPSYSLAKSVFASAALMRLEKTHPGTRNLPAASFVPECATSGTWSGTTLEHLLDMTSGVYGSVTEYADENSADAVQKFFVPESHRQKIDYACNFSHRRERPGRTFVYRTFDTYILGTALNALVKKERGADQDIFDDVLVAEVMTPLALSPTARVSLRTLDQVAQPFTGYGLTLLPDDVAKLGEFFNPAHEGDNLLDPAMRSAALQLDPSDRGMITGPAGTLRYNNGFWAFKAEQLPGCKEPQYVPFMSGFGGISVVLMPNGVTYYYFSDNDEYRFRRAIGEASRVRGFCQPGLPHNHTNKQANLQ